MRYPSAQHLIARHAGSALWLARYMERIENLARLLDVTKTFASEGEADRNWLSLLRINGDGAAFFAKHDHADATSVARFYLLDATNPASVQTAIACARENARTLRALISTEMWLQINVFHGRIRALGEADVAPEKSIDGLRHAEGGRAGAWRHHRGHVLSRPMLAFLHDGPAPGAHRPDHAADRYQVQCAAAVVPLPMPRSMPANGTRCCAPRPAIMRIAANIRMATCRGRSPGSCC